MAGSTERWWRISFISGWINKVATLLIVGVKTPNLSRFNRRLNKNGFRRDQAASCGFVEDAVEEALNKLLARIGEDNARTHLLLSRILEVQIDDTVSVHSYDELVGEEEDK